jgi:hypothetical protein
MKRDPEIVDLQRYRQAAKAANAAKLASSRPKPEALLGSRPRAGLVLAVIAVTILALWLIPKFL